MGEPRTQVPLMSTCHCLQKEFNLHKNGGDKHIYNLVQKRI